tara:strand:- start:1633 stop:2118 length:486 start_codon:yes stop_codon:yes gene_type:complete
MERSLAILLALFDSVRATVATVAMGWPLFSELIIVSFLVVRCGHLVFDVAPDLVAALVVDRRQRVVVPVDVAFEVRHHKPLSSSIFSVSVAMLVSCVVLSRFTDAGAVEDYPQFLRHVTHHVGIQPPLGIEPQLYAPNPHEFGPLDLVHVVRADPVVAVLC